MIAIEAGPELADSLVAGALLTGPLVAGALVVTGVPGGGALLVTGLLGGGALLVTGALVAGALLVVDGDLGGALDGGALELGGALDVGAEDDGPGPLLDGDDGDDGDDGGSGEDRDDGGCDDGAVDGPAVEGGGGVVGPWDVSSATLSVTYAPNANPLPAGGSEAVTRASSGGRAFPSYPTASPASASRRLASPNVVPASRGTARSLRVSKVLSCVPVVPTGRSMPTAGSPTSTRTSRCIFRDAGCTATTAERSYPRHFLFPPWNLTEILFVSPVKGRSGFPHEHFTAGSPCSSTRTAIPASSRELKGTAFPFL